MTRSRFYPPVERVLTTFFERTPCGEDELYRVHQLLVACASGLTGNRADDNHGGSSLSCAPVRRELRTRAAARLARGGTRRPYGIVSFAEIREANRQQPFGTTCP
jgi:hypothetical protein